MSGLMAGLQGLQGLQAKGAQLGQGAAWPLVEAPGHIPGTQPPFSDAVVNSV